ncbi:unnamed protein product [Callosobruchus maculatus]|uniref:Anaphase-promoting complex subunit 5 n=3 Tax=Callosobruchus maculatus TaxID=64391 RepID=A0A653D663_CALMS|nr:unnamed protein product [Callosobruchus maculatus]
MAANKDVRVSRKPQTETINSHKLSVTILIRNYCIYRESDEYKDMDDEALRCKHRRDMCVLILRLLQSPDLSLSQLHDLLSSSKYVIPNNVIESFDKVLADLYKGGIGYLLDIVESLEKIMAISDTSLSESKSFILGSAFAKTSIVGHYVRRFAVYFDKLTFSEMTSVYENFQCYYEQWQKNFLKCGKSQESNFDMWADNKETWSRRQAELFIATQAALLSNNEGKALPPEELHKRITNILESNPDLVGAHFLSYLNYLRVDEFCGAMSSLLHCFDASLDPNIKYCNDEKSKRHRFAALNLAILHYHFGHVEEALAALKESIKISQEANDNVCLQHALSWLYRLTTVNEDKLIVQCILKSTELSLSYTASLGLQTFGQYGCMRTGKSYAIFETLAKSDMINCQHNYKDLISNNYAMKAALWQVYGKTEMSSLWSQLLLYQNMDCIFPTKAYHGDGFCLAVCNVANCLLAQGEYQLTTCVLDYAKRCFPNEPNSHIWMLCENYCAFTRAMYHERWPEAESAAQKISVHDKWEGLLRLAQVCYQRQDYADAQKLIETLLNQYENDSAYRFNDRYYYIQAKILEAEIQFSASYPNISQGVLSMLYATLTEARSSSLDYHTTLIYLHIAKCLITLDLTSQALMVLDKCMIQVLAHGGRYDRARAVLLFVKCLVADSHKFKKKERRKVVAQCAEMLTKARKDFEKVEAFSRAKDVLFLQAHLYNLLEKRTERNKCALEYRLLDEEYKTENFQRLIKYL